MKNTRKVIYAGLLIALEILMTRFIQIPLSWAPIFALSKDRISLGFLPIAVAGMLMGPVYGGLVGAIADIIRAIIFPVGGAFNPLFTISAGLKGVIYGSILKKNCSFTRIIIASLIIGIFINSLLNSYFVHISYGTPFITFLTIKLWATAANLFIQVLILRLVLNPIKANFKEL